MNKKKILVLAMTLSMVAILAIGGTIAYFTDTDAETNVFTVGKVNIDLKENFEQNSKLYPGVPVPKEAWIVNESDSENAYVWAEILIPAALDDQDKNSPDAPGLGNSLHTNYPGANAKEYAQNTNPSAKYYNADLSKLWIFQHNEDGVSYGYAGQETVGSILYNKMIMFYTEVLKPGEQTSLFNSQSYMDKAVYEKDGSYVLIDGKTVYDGPWQIIVRAYGIQEDGFENVIDAWKAYDGDFPAVKEDGQL